jgi:hypothetical protein
MGIGRVAVIFDDRLRRDTKGATIFARIPLEMGRKRPDIPFLVVEGPQTPD